MSQLFETGQFACDPAALITYLYGEGSEPEREAMVAHLAHCAACTEEAALLDATRRQLAAWTPPARSLGFRITRAEGTPATDSERPQVETGATVLRPARWWNQPLPAWAQMAAAVLIFGAGLAIGTARSTTASAPSTVATGAGTTSPATVRSAPSAATASAVSRDELFQFEHRLQSEIAQLRTAAPATTDNRAVLQQVSGLIAASEERQRRELAFRTAQVVNDLSNARQIDLMRIDQRLNNFERATGRRVESNQLDIKSLAQTVGYTLR